MEAVISDIRTLAAAPAGGAATGQVVAMVVGLTIAFGLLGLLGELHRRGRRTPLGMLAAFSARVSGLPGWAALPLAVTGISLVGALFGYMWESRCTSTRAGTRARSPTPRTTSSSPGSTA